MPGIAGSDIHAVAEAIAHHSFPAFELHVRVSVAVFICQVGILLVAVACADVEAIAPGAPGGGDLKALQIVNGLTVNVFALAVNITVAGTDADRSKDHDRGGVAGNDGEAGLGVK